jgi:site-specific recombinase XerD
MQISIQEYEEYLRADGKAEKTIQSYLSDVRAFTAYLSTINIATSKQLTRQHIVTYRKQLLSQNRRPATVNKAINSLHSYTDWLIKNGILPAQQPLVRPAQDRIKIASGSEASPDVSLRDRLIIHFLLYTGTRVGELCSTRISDLDLLTGQLKIIGKGGKYREVPLRPDLVAMIQTYIKQERAVSKYASSPYLFVSQRAEILNRDTVNTILEKLGAATGLHLYPHKFRHIFCTRLIGAGVLISTVSKLAGHAGVDTTARYYINISREEKQAAVNLL